jgi:hypothetical protein
VLVLDTSAYMNGRRDHFMPSILPTVWVLVGEAIEDGRIVLPREVYRELRAQDDDLASWINGYSDQVAEPSEEVQRLAGQFASEFPRPGIRNGADPWILAEAQLRGFTVVTYEGRSFAGIPFAAARWARSMPGVCQRFGIPCCTLPEALGRLGLSL